MRKVKVTADLELNSDSGRITVKSTDDSVDISVSSASAVIFPLSTYFTFKKYIGLSKNLSQSINIVVGNKEVLMIDNGDIHYLQKWWLFKFLFKAIFK